MATATGLTILGNWSKEVHTPLANALAVSMDVMGRTGEQACRHALILMAQSARKVAKKSAKKRPILRDKLGKYVEVFHQPRAIKKLHEWAFSSGNNTRLNGTFEEARTIGASGLAGRSWMWGLARLGGKEKSRRIAGTFYVGTITGENLNGYFKKNTLSYIDKAMPSGWESAVEIAAGNKIMAQARDKMERKWRGEMMMGKRLRGEKSQSARKMADYFLKGL